MTSTSDLFPCRECGEEFYFSDDVDPICDDCLERELWAYENIDVDDDVYDEEGRVIFYPSDDEEDDQYLCN
jgi:hypothetical protein